MTDGLRLWLFSAGLPAVSLALIVGPAIRAYRLTGTRPILRLQTTALVNILLAVAVSGGIGAGAYIYLRQGLRHLNSLPLEIIGAPFLVAAAALGGAAYHELGDAFGAGAFPAETAARLVETGPYRLTRHPQFTAYVTYLTGFVLSVTFAFIPILLAALALLETQARLEEQHLVKLHPDSYPRYRQRTRDRIIPGDRLLP